MRKLFARLLSVILLLTLIVSCAPATVTPAEPATAPTSAEAAPANEAAPTEAEAAEEAPAPTEPAAELTSAEPKILTYIMAKEPISLDTSKTNDSMSAEVLFHLSEGLLRNYDGKIIPGVAETWEMSDDGLTYTFHLRDSVWQDGEPVTAQQFVYSFKRFLSPSIAASFANEFYAVKNAEAYNTGKLTDESQLGFEAVDEKTIVLTLEHPTPYFLNTLSSNAYFYPLRQDFVEQFGDTHAADENSFLSNGPFTLKKWEHEASITLEKNPKYWDAVSVKLDEIVQLIIADANTAVSMYDAGEVDYIPELSPDFVANYPDAHAALTGSFQFLEFNIQGMTPENGKVLSNINFRKALSYAIDRESVSLAVDGASTQPANRITSPQIAGIADTFDTEYPITENIVSLNGDPEKARAFLETALVELNITVDQLPEITYVAMESTKHKLYAEAFIDAWDKVLGIKTITIQTLPVPQALQAGMEGKFDIFLLGMGSDTDPYIFLSNWMPENSTNWVGWVDQDYAEMLAATETITDPAERFAALLDAEVYLLANGPIEPLFFPGRPYIYQDYVSGLVKSPIGAASQLIYADVNK